MRDDSGSPCPHTVIKHAFGRHKSPAWRFRSGSRLGRRTPRSGSLPVHDLHQMGREACCRHDMAYPVSWRRVTHLQRSWRWGNVSRFESSRPAILNDKCLRNRVYVRFRRLFRLSHRTCDPSSKWAVQRPGPAARRSNGPAVRRAAHAPPRSSPPMRRAAPTANFPAAGGRRPAGETRCVALIERFSFSHFQFH